MNVLVDSVIWSLAFRRKTVSTPEAARLGNLISRGEAHLVGAVRQEVLTGIREQSRFLRIRDRLRSFPDVPLTEMHYERAAYVANICRSKGVQGSPTDFLLCAVAQIEGMPIFTTDVDFDHFARFVPVRLVQ